MVIKYAGVGSRQTPEKILTYMEEFGRHLAQRGFILRTGNCIGPDQAFARGAALIDPKLIEIYLPWKSYNSDITPLGAKVFVKGYDGETREFAKQYHPNWEGMNKHSRAFHARNSTIVMGENLDDPVDFILCWTPDKAHYGGTGQAIRIADAFRIPIINLSHDGFDLEFEQEIRHVVKILNS